MNKPTITLTTAFLLLLSCWALSSNSPVLTNTNLIQNPDFRQRSTTGIPAAYQLIGSAEFCYPGNPRTDVSDFGAALKSSGNTGEISQTIHNIDPKDGKWFRFTFRGLPQQNFKVNNDNLYMKVEFLGSDSITQYDGKDKKIYPQIEQARKDLTVNGIRHINGAEVWQTYQMDFSLPFPQVRALKLSVGFTDGAANNTIRSEFFVNDFELIRIPTPPRDDAIQRKKLPRHHPRFEN